MVRFQYEVVLIGFVRRGIRDQRSVGDAFQRQMVRKVPAISSGGGKREPGHALWQAETPALPIRPPRLVYLDCPPRSPNPDRMGTANPRSTLQRRLPGRIACLLCSSADLRETRNSEAGRLASRRTSNIKRFARIFHDLHCGSRHLPTANCCVSSFDGGKFTSSRTSPLFKASRWRSRWNFRARAVCSPPILHARASTVVHPKKSCALAPGVRDPRRASHFHLRAVDANSRTAAAISSWPSVGGAVQTLAHCSQAGPTSPLQTGLRPQFWRRRRLRPRRSNASARHLLDANSCAPKLTRLCNLHQLASGSELARHSRIQDDSARLAHAGDRHTKLLSSRCRR